MVEVPDGDQMSRAGSSDRGFVYLVFGDQFLLEAADSARQLRRCHDEPICLITDQQPNYSIGACFDEVRIAELGHSYRDKILMSLSPYSKSIFLDSDTYVVASLRELFSILDRFDIAVQFTEGGNHYKLEGVPAAFHEPSAGIVAWRKTPEVMQFFEFWKNAYDEIEQVEGGLEPGISVAFARPCIALV